ncbi:MAG: single-stranded-DNA-specific exonuclease RecJ [Gammaproteobacteria bacterium]
MPPLLQRIYSARGIHAPAQLDYQLKQLLPFTTLKNIDAACELLHHALNQQQRIIIIGDFDADGATSTTLAVTALRALGAKHVTYLVPNRFEYGYGLTPEIVAVAQRWQPDLIITVDNGIASHEGVAAAIQAGIQVLITDHHLPAATLPVGAVIVNPNQPDDAFASKNLAGVGVIFYVMLALRSYLRDCHWFSEQKIAEPNMAQFLDLVALGTVADVVPLDHNNRVLVQQGLQRIRASQVRPGIQALLEIAKRDVSQLVASDLGFAIGPRLNAAGRLDDMSLGIECLLSEDINRAGELAAQLDELNRERKQIETSMQQEAFTILNKMKFAGEQQLPLGLSLYDPTWHQGVIGILASRVKDKFHRPVIAFANASETEIKGSARSIQGVHIRDVLDTVATQHPGLITKFGGHAMAAGLSLPVTHLADFSRAFADEVAKHVDATQLQRKILSDGELSYEELHLDIALLLREHSPWGQGFPEPLFDGVFTVVEQRLLGQNHLKMTLQLAEYARLFDAIAFNINPDVWPNHRCNKVHIAYRLDVNAYQGLLRLQLLVEHLQAC